MDNHQIYVTLPKMKASGACGSWVVNTWVYVLWHQLGTFVPFHLCHPSFSVCISIRSINSLPPNEGFIGINCLITYMRSWLDTSYSSSISIFFSVFCNNLISLEASTKCQNHFNHLIDEAMIHLLSVGVWTVLDCLSSTCAQASCDIYFFPQTLQWNVEFLLKKDSDSKWTIISTMTLLLPTCSCISLWKRRTFCRVQHLYF